jgi:hypothetical protein
MVFFSKHGVRIVERVNPLLSHAEMRCRPRTATLGLDTPLVVGGKAAIEQIRYVTSIGGPMSFRPRVQTFVGITVGIDALDRIECDA